MKKIKLHYYHYNNNFGDILNIPLLNKLFGVQVVHADHIKSEYTAIGSILESFLRPKSSLKFKIAKNFLNPINVYGSGFIKPVASNQSLFRKSNFLAVRGELTKNELSKLLKHEIKNITLGDPGLLTPLIQNSEPKEFDLGIVGHLVDKSNPILRQIKNEVPNSIVLDIQEDDPISFVKSLTKCERIISSAMHPLIVADSYGIPNARMILSDRLFSNGGNFKFNDYYSVFKSPKQNVFDLRQYSDLSFLKSRNNFTTNISGNEVAEIQSKLIDAFPLK